MKLIYTFLFCVFLAKITFAQCNIEDYKALRAFYIASNGDNWKNKDNWDVKSENPPISCNLSKFRGVYLNEMGRVSQIALAQNNLVGTLTPEIKRLAFVNTMWLDNNQLSGTIPKEIGELQKLERIALSFNKLIGEIPIEFYSIKSLKEFSFGYNNLVGSIPTNIKNLENLIRLECSTNKLSGALPKEIGELKLLNEIDLSNNQFEGCFPSSFKNFCNKITNFNGNTFLANWQNFCKEPSNCTFSYKFKEVNFKLDTLFISNSTSKKQMIFLPEGFTLNELPKFRSFVIKMTSKLKEHFPSISFEAVIAYIPSNESGISNSLVNPIIKKDTYFETDHTSNSYGIPAVTINDRVALPFIKHYFPESKYPLSNRIITYIANSEQFGAYAAAIEGVSSNYYIGIEQSLGTINDAEWVFAHELGHFFGLADIADMHEVPQGEWANSTKEIDRNKIKWKGFIKESTPIPTPKNGIYNNEIGLFSVEDRQNKPTGWYRPCNTNCLMKGVNQTAVFCKVCGNHLDRKDNLPFAKVENGKFGGYFYAGNKVNIEAVSPEPTLMFSHWEGEGVIFGNKLLSKTTFTMPNSTVNIKAVYKSPVLGIEPFFSEKVKLYPNPNNGEFWVNISDNYIGGNIEIFNLIGSKLYSITPSQNNFSIFFKGLAGIYYLKVSDKQKFETIKMVIVH